MEQDLCTVEGCKQPIKVRKHRLCSAHYQRMVKYGHALGGGRIRKDMATVCTVDGCDSPTLARDLCNPHYIRNRLYGNPTGVSTRPHVPRYKGESPDYIRNAVTTRERTDACWTDGGFSMRNGEYPMIGGVAVGYVSMEADGRPRPAGTYQLHSCDNPTCWAPHHLRWGSPQENADDRELRERGFRNVGVNHGMAKLTEDGVRWIRATHEAGKNLPQRHPDKVSIRAMAHHLGVSTMAIHSVIKSRTWTHVQ